MTDPTMINRTQFWWISIRWPSAIFVLLAAIFGTRDLDERIASVIFYDAQQGWLGGSSRWTQQFLHMGGQWLIRCVVLAALCVWLASFFQPSLEKWRRAAGFVSVSMILSIGSVGLLKHVTNVHCPWDLIPFGGQFPYVHLFARRPPSLRVGHCFPAAHASCGYALFALYFVGREVGPRWARAGLWIAILMGAVFGLAQQSRGAHFLSHDLWSATISWAVSLTLYCFAFSCSLRTASASVRSPRLVTVPASES